MIKKILFLSVFVLLLNNHLIASDLPQDLQQPKITNLTSEQNDKASTDIRLRELEQSVAYVTGGLTEYRPNMHFGLAFKGSTSAGAACFLYLLATKGSVELLISLQVVTVFYYLIKIMGDTFRTNTPMSKLPPPKEALLEELKRQSKKEAPNG